MNLEQLIQEAKNRGYGIGTIVNSLGGSRNITIKEDYNEWFLTSSGDLRSCGNILLYNSKNDFWANILSNKHTIQQPIYEIY